MPNDPDLVNRPPGWSLIANKNGPQGYHVIKSAGLLATVVTLCGITGRKISDVAREIPLCQGCLDARKAALGILDPDPEVV